MTERVRRETPGDGARAHRHETGHPPLTPETITADLDRVLTDGVHVFVNLAETQTPVRSRIRAWKEGQYLLLDAPQPSDRAVKTEAGATWLLQYKLHGLMCEAKTEYIDQAPNDPTGVYVTYPKAIRVHPLREHYRAHVNATARYGILEGGASVPETLTETTISDLSLGGCAFRSQEKLARDTRVYLAIVPSPGATPVHFTGTVRRASEGQSGLLIGVQFDVLTWEQRPVLVRMLGKDAVRADPFADENP